MSVPSAWSWHLRLLPLGLRGSHGVTGARDNRSWRRLRPDRRGRRVPRDKGEGMKHVPLTKPVRLAKARARAQAKRDKMRAAKRPVDFAAYESVFMLFLNIRRVLTARERNLVIFMLIHRKNQNQYAKIRNVSRQAVALMVKSVEAKIPELTGQFD